jgi:sugar O-acyltransferase (sialic acid O-acetyltransferase NeuD family)
MKKLLLFPFNGNAREAASVVEAINRRQETWLLLGFIDDDPKKHGLRFGGYPVLGGREQLAHNKDTFVLAVPGRPETFQQRQTLIASLEVKPEQFASIIHPSVSIGIGCTIGVNTLLMANVVLTAAVSVGHSVVILPNTVISHESTVSDYCLIGSNVTISGGVAIGKNCYLGSGARIIQEAVIGEKSLVGMGAVVIRPVTPGSVVAGNPAKNIRDAQ